MLDPIKTAGKSFKSRIMHLTEWEAGMLLIAAVALNIVLIAIWLL